MGGAYTNTGYNPQGYDNAGFFDNYSAHYYGGPETTTYTGGGGGGGATSGYRGYPQPQPSPQQQPYRRSRTAPPRTLPRNQAASANYARYRSQRGISADPTDYRYYRSFSGPAKRPTPMYRKRRIPPPKPQPSNYQI
uniref:Uncharacterized protein n=1 Tax=Panagrolaimus sp. ES5 TaxID=591445 RepID=A0AC34GII5_9BILA